MNKLPLVSVIIAFLNEARFLAEAIDSVRAQTYEPWELLLVDDGSTDGSSEIAQRYAAQHPAQIRYLEHAGHRNHGVSASRNLGIHSARGEFITFLDGDDVFLPEKLSRQVPALMTWPKVAMLYGSTEYWYSWAGASAAERPDFVPPLSVDLNTPIAPPSLLVRLLQGAATAPCICGVLVRRESAVAVGGFVNAVNRLWDDPVFLAKLCLDYPVVAVDGHLERYRQHPDSDCAVAQAAGQYYPGIGKYLNWLRGYLRERHITDPALWAAFQHARRENLLDQHPFIRAATAQIHNVREQGAWWSQSVALRTKSRWKKMQKKASGTLRAYPAQIAVPQAPALGATLLSWTSEGTDAVEIHVNAPDGPLFARGEPSGRAMTGSWVADRMVFYLQNVSRGLPLTPANTLAAVMIRVLVDAKPRIKRLDFGDLRQLTPISPVWGLDRGMPVDRYYIERFLSANAADIRGHTLEIKDDNYTRRFGAGRVVDRDVLDIDPNNQRATIIADLSCADNVPSNTFDCVVLIQTLQLIPDVPAAIRTLHRILAPGGVGLVTLPGVSQISHKYDKKGSFYWAFTNLSAQDLFAQRFQAENLTISSHGNVLAAVAFLHGLAVEELQPDELEYEDADYPMLITVRAVKSQPVVDVVPEPETAPAFIPSLSRPIVDDRALVLLYHRIIEASHDPWSLSVSPQFFAEQLEVLCARARPVSLDKLDLNEPGGRGGSWPVAITFDDGYADNFINAKPLLERFDAPATFFVSTSFVENEVEFWWDELEQLILQPGSLPESLRMHHGGHDYFWELGGAAHYSQQEVLTHKDWSAGSGAWPTARHKLFIELWRLLQSLPARERRALLDDIAAWAGATPLVRPSYRPMSPSEVKSLAGNDLFQIGAHTISHPDLSGLPFHSQRAEIQGGKTRLEEIVGRPINAFSYPHGALTDETVALVRECGFLSAFTTEQRALTSGMDMFRLPRIAVPNCDGRAFARWLDGWFSTP